MGIGLEIPRFPQEMGVKAKGLHRVDGLMGLKRPFFEFGAPGGYGLRCDRFSVCHLAQMLPWV